jgi:hypothetical protein
MACKKLNPIFAVVGIATFAFGLWAAFVYNHRNGPPKKPEPRFEEVEITGFDQVTSARDGDIVTVLGDIDGKGVCLSYQLGKSDDICETWFLESGRQFPGMPIRIRMCSEVVTANCMLPFTRQQYACVLDAEGKTIDFQGYKQIPEMGPNAWMKEGGFKLWITGRVTRINGISRFIEPISKIEVGPAYN